MVTVAVGPFNEPIKTSIMDVLTASGYIFHSLFDCKQYMNRIGVVNDGRSIMSKYGYILPSRERRNELAERLFNDQPTEGRYDRFLKESEKVIIEEPVKDRRVTVVIPEEDVIEPVEVVIPAEPPVEEVEDKTLTDTIEGFISKKVKGRGKVERFCMNYIHQISVTIVVVMAILFITLALMMYGVIMDRMFRRNRLIQRMEEELTETIKEPVINPRMIGDSKVPSVEVSGEVVNVTPLTGGGRCGAKKASRPRPRLVNKKKCYDFNVDAF